MTRAEIPIEMTGLPERLRADFTGLLPEAASGTADERETNFLTRALAAFAVHKLAGCTLDAAAASVVDGGGDGGIDAVHYNAATNTLWVVQSKYHQNGRGEPDLGSVAKFKTGLENLLSGRFEAFTSNAAWNRLLPAVKIALENGGLLVRAALVYSGINTVSDDRTREFEDLRRRFSPDDDDYLQIGTYGLTRIHDWLTGADLAPGVEYVELTIHRPGWAKEPYETVYGMVSLADLAALYRQHGRRLIAANIRGYKGNTEVNDQIAATAAEEPENFFYLNNGLTAYCERLEVNHIDRANAERKRVRTFGLSVVNGAQTLVSIANCCADPEAPPPPGFAFLKVISLERCVDDRAFAARITRSTNFQNRIGPRDFAAQDEQQERIKNQLVLSDIHYHYKDAADTPAPNEHNFTLEEATTACACLDQSKDCELVALALADPELLWSFEDAYPEGNIYRSRYERVFRGDRSARAIWRAVQVQRIVLHTMQAMTAPWPAELFWVCRWLVLNLVYLRTRMHEGANLMLAEEEHMHVVETAQNLAGAIREACLAEGVFARSGSTFVLWEGKLPATFGTADDCKRIRTAVLAGASVGTEYSRT